MMLLLVSAAVAERVRVCAAPTPPSPPRAVSALARISWEECCTNVQTPVLGNAGYRYNS